MTATVSRIRLPSGEALLRRWLNDAPPKVLRFPIFDESTPTIVITTACVRFNRRPRVDHLTQNVHLEKRRP